jgi:high-affinity iron transporter
VRLLGFVLVAGALVAAALASIDRDPQPKPARTAHVAIAPGASAPGRAGKVTGTSMSPQQAADAALEDGRHPDLVPLPEHAFAAPIARYRAYAGGQAARMGDAAQALRHAIARGDRAGAQRAWAEAFDRWLRVGAAYGALGGLDGRITASLDALERSPLAAAPARALAASSRRLPAAVRTAELAPADYATRAHEILEDVQRDRLDGAAGVRATADGLAATRTVIGTLRTVLQGRGDVLQQVDTRLAQLSDTLAGIRRAHGAWPAPAALPPAERERLTGRLGAALEALAGIPATLETSLPPTIPALK